MTEEESSRCYNCQMISSYENPKVTFGLTMSFTGVVLGVYLSIFTSGAELTASRVIILSILATCYIFIGIYIYSISAGYKLVWLRLLYISIELIVGISIVVLSKGLGVSLLIFIPLIGHSVTLFSPRVMLIINGTILLLYLGLSNLYAPGWERTINDLPLFLAGQIFVILFMQMHLEEEIAHSKIKQLINELGTANQSLKEYAAQVETLTLMRERNRLAREIHDGLGHYLTVVHMQIQAAEAVLASNPEKAHSALVLAQQQAQNALIDVRRSVAALRDTTDIRIPLITRVEQLAASASSENLKVIVKVSGKPSETTAQIELSIFRIIQEGIQNCLKHANAHHLWINMEYRSSSLLWLTIQDDGIGSTAPGTGYGLLGMNERVTQLGGKIEVGTKSGNGFRIEIEVPL